MVQIKWSLLIMLFMFVGSVTAVKLEGAVNMKPSSNNVTYLPNTNASFTKVIISSTTFNGNDLNSTARGNATVRIIAYSASNVTLNVSGDVTYFNFTGVDSTLNFKYKTDKFSNHFFTVTLSSIWDLLYTFTPSIVITEEVVGSHRISSRVNCIEKGGIWYASRCFTCDGIADIVDGKLICLECEEGFMWDGDRCVLDTGKFKLMDYLKGHQKELSVIGLIASISLSAFIIYKGGVGEKDDAET